MPSSFSIFDRVVEQLIDRIRPTRALDVGAGAGKYGRMLRSAVTNCEVVAVEVDEAAVGQFKLHELYARVDVASAGAWCRDRPHEAFDLAIVGDCLQQMPKSEGLDLLNALTYRCAWLVVTVCEFVVQDGAELPWHATHRSVWSERDLQWHDLWAWDNCRATSLALLRGYRPSPLTIDALVAEVNGSALPVLDFDDVTVVRPCRLRLVDHAREVQYRLR